MERHADTWQKVKAKFLCVGCDPNICKHLQIGSFYASSANHLDYTLKNTQILSIRSKFSRLEV